MNDTEESEPRARTQGGRGQQRRRRIRSALHDCVLEKGYAKTTLADIGRVAGMYPSHLLYYYTGKDAILEEYFQKVSDRILEKLDVFSVEPPEQQIELLANFFFASGGITKSEIGFMLECFGVSVNDPTLHQRKSELDKRSKVYLTRLFEQTPHGENSPARDLAEVAYAMLIGLRTAVFFDDEISLQQARNLFRTSMLNLSGYGNFNS